MKYFYSIVEECVLNPKYDGYRGGRVEVLEEGKDYAVDEIRFMIPEELFAGFRDWLDFKGSNKPIYLRSDFLYKKEHEIN